MTEKQIKERVVSGVLLTKDSKYQGWRAKGAAGHPDLFLRMSNGSVVVYIDNPVSGYSYGTAESVPAAVMEALSRGVRFVRATPNATATRQAGARPGWLVTTDDGEEHFVKARGRHAVVSDLDRRADLHVSPEALTSMPVRVRFLLG